MSPKKPRSGVFVMCAVDDAMNDARSYADEFGPDAQAAFWRELAHQCEIAEQEAEDNVNDNPSPGARP